MNKYLQYLWYVLCHKYFVYVACRRLGVSLWQAVIHDWSKFLPSEFMPYANYFYGFRGMKSEASKQAFNQAWLYHQRRNLHHWQYWLLQEDDPRGRYTIQSWSDLHPMMLAQNNIPVLYCEVVEHPDNAVHQKAYDLLAPIVKELNTLSVPLEMPEKYAREMVADWYGAGRAITGRWECPKWYSENRSKINLHPKTRAFVEQLIQRTEREFYIMNFNSFESYSVRDRANDPE